MSTCSHCKGSGKCQDDFHSGVSHFGFGGIDAEGVDHPSLWKNLSESCPSCGVYNTENRPPCPHCNGESKATFRGTINSKKSNRSIPSGYKGVDIPSSSSGAFSGMNDDVWLIFFIPAAFFQLLINLFKGDPAAWKLIILGGGYLAFCIFYNFPNGVVSGSPRMDGNLLVMLITLPGMIVLAVILLSFLLLCLPFAIIALFVG